MPPIRTARRSLGLTQKQFAKKARIPQGYLSELERGRKKNPGVKIIRRIIKASEGRLVAGDFV